MSQTLNQSYGIEQNITNTTKQITIINSTNCVVDQKMLSACLARAGQFLCEENCKEVNLIINPRIAMNAPVYLHPGWLEYVMQIHFEGLRILEVHCVQRKPHLEIEFCS